MTGWLEPVSSACQWIIKIDTRFYFWVHADFLVDDVDLIRWNHHFNQS